MWYQRSRVLALTGTLIYPSFNQIGDATVLPRAKPRDQSTTMVVYIGHPKLSKNDLSRWALGSALRQADQTSQTGSRHY